MKPLGGSAVAVASELASAAEARAVVDSYKLAGDSYQLVGGAPWVGGSCVCVCVCLCVCVSVSDLLANGRNSPTPPAPCPSPHLPDCLPCPLQDKSGGLPAVAADLLSFLRAQQQRVALVSDVAAAGVDSATPVVGATKVGVSDTGGREKR